jgi:RecJ-like exonuclease
MARKFWFAILGGLGGAVLGALSGAIIGAAFAHSLEWGVLIYGALYGALGAGVAGAVWVFIDTVPSSEIKRLPRFTPDNADYRLERCAWCQGYGEVKKRPCEVCYGRGSLLVTQPAQNCTHCRGKGRLFLGRKCGTCGGAGWLHKPLGENVRTIRKLWKLGKFDEQ